MEAQATEHEVIERADEAISLLVEEVREHGLVPSTLAGKIAVRVRGDAAYHLIRQGLIYEANNRLHHGRSGRGDGRSESEHRLAPSDSAHDVEYGGTVGLREATEHFMRLREVTLQTADGERMAPLIKLTVEDHDANATRFHSQEVGARRKKEFCERAAKSCRSAGVDRIEELSEKTREKLERKAQEAWQ